MLGMRIIVPVILTLLLAGCALPFGLKWPRMPWHKPSPKPEYCIVSIEAESAQRISTGNDAVVHLPCTVTPSAPVER
jgi:hypothetical protein